MHGVDEHGKPALVRSAVRRAELMEQVAKLPASTIGMEACRQFVRFGHKVRLMAPKFVAPYRMSGKRGKNDAADAAAICKAMQRPSMRFVPVKTEQAQSRLCVHRIRRGFVEQRTAMINRLRGLLSEFGIVMAQKANTVRRQAGEHLQALPQWASTAVADALSEIHRLDERLSEYDRHVALMAAADERSQRLMRLQGIGATTASALLASIGNGHDLANGRQLAAWQEPPRQQRRAIRNTNFKTEKCYPSAQRICHPSARSLMFGAGIGEVSSKRTSGRSVGGAQRPE